MGKFTVGQKVRVREGLKGGNHYGVFFNDFMEKQCGKEFEVSEITFGGRYYLKGSEWMYSEEMLEEVKPEKQVEPLMPMKVLQLETISKMEIYVEKVIVNDPATILFYKSAVYDENGQFSHWSSNLKRVVAKCNKDIGDKFDVETGVWVATAKAYRKEIDKLMRKL